MGSEGSAQAAALAPLPEWRLVLCTLAMAGIQVCYAVQINMGSSHLLLMGLSERAVSLAWLAGPLSGLIVQPIVGVMSDRCVSSLGRRRPFIIAGVVFTSCALLMFANAEDIAALLVRNADAAPRASLAIAIFSFFLLDFGIQAIQAPLRALVTDILPNDQLPKGNAYIGGFTGLGNLVGSLLAATRLSAIFPFFPSDVQALFAIAAAILCVAVAACVLSTKEVPLIRSRGDAYTPLPGSSGTPDSGATTLLREERTSARVWRVLKDVPRPFWRVFTVQLFTWCGFFTLFVYVNTWVGRNIYLGTGTAASGSEARATFERGVRLGGKGNALTAVVTLGYSVLLPSLIERLGVLPLYIFSQLIEFVCLTAAFFIRGTPGQLAPSPLLRLATLIDIGAFGIVWATTMGVPWAVIGKALNQDERYSGKIGLFTTLFNVSQSFPQLIVAFSAPFILAHANNDPSVVMVAGGLSALVGAALIYILRVDLYDDPVDGEDSQRELGVDSTPALGERLPPRELSSLAAG